MKKYVDNSVYCAIKNLFDSKPNFNANLVESQLENSKENLDDLLTARYICSKYLYETLADAIPLDPDGYKPSQNEIIERELQNGRGADFLLAMQYGIQSLGKRISETKAKEKMKLYKVKKPRRGVIWFADDTVQMTMSSLFDDGEL